MVGTEPGLYVKKLYKERHSGDGVGWDRQEGALLSEKSFSQLVLVGSSAGGIEALSELVPALPEDFPAPIVLAQHLDPERESNLGEILSRRSALPVRTVVLYPGGGHEDRGLYPLNAGRIGEKEVMTEVEGE